MPRKGAAPIRPVTPDAKYGDRMVSTVVNKVMWDGKKNTAEQIVYGAMEFAADRLKIEPLSALHKALEAVKPLVEVKSRRVGGATYQVPVEVRPDRRQALAFRWLVSFARSRSETTMVDRLSGELMDASANRGGAVKKREDTHRMAEANKAFSHYRW